MLMVLAGANAFLIRQHLGRSIQSEMIYMIYNPSTIRDLVGIDELTGEQIVEIDLCAVGTDSAAAGDVFPRWWAWS